MKFSIRFADQIVGALIILALGMLIFVIFMLGSSQRWFSRDYYYKSYFPSAIGLSQNMAVQYKGFTIGHVKSIKLVDDHVEVRFTIFDTYIDRVREGSIVEVIVSPIGALGGNQFLFYPGTGMEQIPEGTAIPIANSPEGRRLLAVGLANRPEQDDNINNIINSVGTTITGLNSLIAEVQEALFTGTDKTSLGRTMGGVEAAATGLQKMAEKLPDDLENTIAGIMVELEPLLKNLRQFSDEIADPDGTVAAILDTEGDVYQELLKSLNALSGNLENLETTTGFIPSQLPQFGLILSDLHGALQTFEDVLVSLTNNPLLKKGIPEHNESKTGGVHTRNMEF